jgi:predicted permease
VYRRLLTLYPADFRSRYEDDLLQAFDDRRTERRFSGSIGGVRLILFLLRDFATSVPLANDTTNPGRGVEHMMSDFWQDLRFSARMLVKNPLFTLVAVTTLALGIGLNAATFSAVHGILLKPLPGAEDPEELLQIYRRWAGIEFGSNSIPHYQDIRDRSGDVFESVAAWYFQPMSISADGQSERTIGMLVSANFFQTYGVRPHLGRAFLPGVEDRDPGAHPVAILGHGFWQTRFGGDPGVVGRTVTLNGQAFEIVGVAPSEFRGPVTFASAPIYAPLMMQYVLDPSTNLIEARGNNMMTSVGRLAEGRSIEQAQEMLDAMLLQLRDEYPESYEDQLGTSLVRQNEAGIHPSFSAAQVGMSTVMMAVVGLLLLIACVNVANLFLARARDRRREMGIRLSLGAARGRLVQQLLTESLLFSVVAGIAGLGLANVATTLLGNFRPPIDGPFDMSVEMDSTVLLFTAVVSLAAGLVFGMAPALQAANPNTVSAIKGDAEGPASRSRVSSSLVVAQMALSLLLLMSSGLFLRSLQSATDIDPGFDEPRSLVTLAVDPALQGYEEARAQEFWDRLLEEVEAMPDVRSAGLAWSLPLGLSSADRGVEIPGHEFADGERTSLKYTWVSEGFLETMGVGLVEGRTFTRRDDDEAAPVVVVNERFAQRFWPGESALGKIVTTAGEDREVVGVVETGKYSSLGEDPTEFMYLPNREVFHSDLTLVARTGGDPRVVLSRVQELVRAVDPDMPVYDVRSMEDHMGIALLPARLGGSVLGIFGLLGLVLAAVGIYGVMAYSVSQRTRELGIRVAMGADRRTVLRLVLGEGLKLALIGTALGIVGAFGAARLVQGLLYDVSAFDPVAFGGVPLVLLMVATLAVYLPARRAASVDPMRALKSE